VQPFVRQYRLLVAALRRRRRRMALARPVRLAVVDRDNTLRCPSRWAGAGTLSCPTAAAAGGPLATIRYRGSERMIQVPVGRRGSGVGALTCFRPDVRYGSSVRQDAAAVKSVRVAMHSAGATWRARGRSQAARGSTFAGGTVPVAAIEWTPAADRCRPINVGGWKRLVGTLGGPNVAPHSTSATGRSWQRLSWIASGVRTLRRIQGRPRNARGRASGVASRPPAHVTAAAPIA